MKFVFIDFSKTDSEKHGKFVQLENGDVEYLVIAPKREYRFHANIINKFCDDRQIDGELDDEYGSYEIFDKSWRIIGGGKWEIKDMGKSFRLYSSSQAYGKFNDEGLAEKIRDLQKFSGFEIIIE